MPSAVGIIVPKMNALLEGALSKNEGRKTNRLRRFAAAQRMHKEPSMDHHDLCNRTFKFACDVSKLCIRLQERGPIIKRLSMKLLDSGTSIGANIEEGRAGQTKPDFIAKNFIRSKSRAKRGSGFGSSELRTLR